ncbi:MAG: FosX/FosE/FosI family fosfomycin resistance hydrolase [Desulfobacula sp.]|jgi:catechol 2,3-dioxygenase-like lactoylglutathione lyase family enzyme
MAIEGISHITFIVQDLERSAGFLKSVLDAEEIYSSGEKFFSLSREKFFMIGGVWVAIMEGTDQTEQTYNHVAFKIPVSEYDGYKDRLTKAGVAFREGRPRIPGEGLSLYFYDYDNHLLELHTGTLKDRLENYEQHSKG